LNALQIKKLHIKSENIDLHITIGEERRWLGGTGHNIPSFEIFISPDCRYTEGTIGFNQPLYYEGKRISGIKLTFKNGVVVEATATENEEALLEMIQQKGANVVGEFSLTPAGFSPIDRPMAHTLFDENMGGQFGNTHIALGMSYDDSYSGDLLTVTKEKLISLGFNDSAVHTDIVSTENRLVFDETEGRDKPLIYRDGKYVFN
jgi:aminopeptidase